MRLFIRDPARRPGCYKVLGAATQEIGLAIIQIYCDDRIRVTATDDVSLMVADKYQGPPPKAEIQCQESATDSADVFEVS
jgi:hypothetical protein